VDSDRFDDFFLSLPCAFPMFPVSRNYGSRDDDVHFSIRFEVDGVEWAGDKKSQK